ncbi:MAG: spermidine synthase [Candidatus Abyssobacteria bacterium SURF_5]|uniref:Spermidine synthase n=1 Tax=Abyssobacteria bacterium (strain SURF_5) TaxID=2093360 RepID=A0A3A4NGI1_ABYX5|nr:MAG: spermidine synthase [Candidatus Abyssubacteria bacterium SURF_5]
MIERTDTYPSVATTHPETSALRDSLSAGYIFFLVLFFCSGMAALIYEITWTRRLTLVFGNTVYSVSTVLVSFMGGLAFGSILFGRFVDKHRKPVRIYGLLEIGIGVFALLLPFALAALNPAYRFLYNSAGFSGAGMVVARFVLSVSVLIIPTTFMGATLPVLSKFAVRRADHTGMGIGTLYALNTLGAVAGCFLGGFVLPGWIGINHSEHLAAAVNIIIGFTALGLSRRLDSQYSAPDEMQENAEPPIAQIAGPNDRLILLLFGVSGLLALAYEVLWTRILILLLGSSIYSFSMILTVYLLGLTAGSLLMARYVDRLKKPVQVFGWIEILIGLSVFAGMFIFRRLVFEQYALQVEPLSYLTSNFSAVLSVVLPPTILMGAAFPLVVKIWATEIRTIGRKTGTLYAVNTVGAILGSFAAGFILIPALGSKNSMFLLIFISILIGVILLVSARSREGASSLNYATAVLLIFPILNLGSNNNFMREMTDEMFESGSGKIVDFKEDATAAVAVIASPLGFKVLSVNGVVMTILCAETQLMAHLPITLAPAPDNMLMICFGMGTTFVSARKAGLEVDFVELCPYVVDTFHHFQKHASMLDQPGVGKIIADGRNYVLLSDKTYDIINIDPPPPPWSAGAVNLYTKEFYELCKQRLTPDGIICQWLPTFTSVLSESQYKMLVKTFMDVFPHTTIWNSPNQMGTYLIGTPERLVIDKNAFDEYFSRPEIRYDLSLYSAVHPPALRVLNGPAVLSLLLLDEDGAREYVSGAPVLTDDLPVIEFPLFKNGSSTKIMHPSLIPTSDSAPSVF